MAELTLYWPDGSGAVIETIPASSTGTILDDAGPYDLIWREGPAIEKPVHDCAALYERLVKMPPEDFVKTYGLLWSRRRGKKGGERIDDIQLARRELKKLLAAKERDDWAAARKWMQERPRVVQLVGVIGEDRAGRPQLEFRPRHLYSLIVAQLIRDWGNGAEYRFCKRPGCPEWFYYGPGTEHRKTAGYCSKRCNLAHAYQIRKEQSK